MGNEAYSSHIQNEFRTHFRISPPVKKSFIMNAACLRVGFCARYFEDTSSSGSGFRKWRTYSALSYVKFGFYGSKGGPWRATRYRSKSRIIS